MSVSLPVLLAEMLTSMSSNQSNTYGEERSPQGYSSFEANEQDVRVKDVDANYIAAWIKRHGEFFQAVEQGIKHHCHKEEDLQNHTNSMIIDSVMLLIRCTKDCTDEMSFPDCSKTNSVYFYLDRPWDEAQSTKNSKTTSNCTSTERWLREDIHQQPWHGIAGVRLPQDDDADESDAVKAMSNICGAMGTEDAIDIGMVELGDVVDELSKKKQSKL